MLKPNTLTDRPPAYQQALEDFGITQLLSYLRNYADDDFQAALMNLEEQELASLATILIQWLTQNLNGRIIASYLNVIRHGNSQVLFDPTNLEIPSHFVDKTGNLTYGKPEYKEGDRIRWKPLSNPTDWGVVIGRFYAYARHRGEWAVCYLILLDEDSPSAAWTVADTAWEEDIEPNTDAEEGENGRTPEWENGRVGESHSFAETPEPTSTPSPHPFIHPSLHTSSGTYSNGRDRNHPRFLTQRELNLIELYSNCQLGMTPKQFYRKWNVNYRQMAYICSRSTTTVERWFTKGRTYRPPKASDLHHLALMDFLLEHFEEIPESLFHLLCPEHRQ